MRRCAAPTGSHSAMPMSLSDPKSPVREANSATPSETRAAAHACMRADARRYAGKSQADSCRGSILSSTAANHGPAGTSSTASSRTPAPVMAAGMPPSVSNSSGQSMVRNMGRTLVAAYDDFRCVATKSTLRTRLPGNSGCVSDGDDRALDGAGLDPADTHVKSETRLRRHVDGAVGIDFVGGVDEVALEQHRRGGHVRGVGESGQRAEGQIARAADAGLHHPAAPQRDTAFRAQCGDVQRLGDAAYPRRLEVDVTAGVDVESTPYVVQ